MVVTDASDPTAGWVRTWGGSDTDSCDSITIDSDGDLLVTGFYEGSVDFDTGPAVDTRISNGNKDAYVSRFPKRGYGIQKGSALQDVTSYTHSRT